MTGSSLNVAKRVEHEASRAAAEFEQVMQQFIGSDHLRRQQESGEYTLLLPAILSTGQPPTFRLNLWAANDAERTQPTNPHGPLYSAEIKSDQDNSGFMAGASSNFSFGAGYFRANLQLLGNKQLILETDPENRLPIASEEAQRTPEMVANFKGFLELIGIAEVLQEGSNPLSPRYLSTPSAEMVLKLSRFLDEAVLPECKKRSSSMQTHVKVALLLNTPNSAAA
jgi:hypothetical protein